MWVRANTSTVSNWNLVFLFIKHNHLAHVYMYRNTTCEMSIWVRVYHLPRVVQRWGLLREDETNLYVRVLVLSRTQAWLQQLPVRVQGKRKTGIKTVYQKKTRTEQRGLSKVLCQSMLCPLGNEGVRSQRIWHLNIDVFSIKCIRLDSWKLWQLWKMSVGSASVFFNRLHVACFILHAIRKTNWRQLLEHSVNGDNEKG